MRRLLILGHLGYVGPKVVEALRSEAGDRQIIGCDTGLFELAPSEPFMSRGHRVDTQHYADVRDLDPSLFNGIDAVIYLAAISNDPMGREFAAPTHQINHHAALSAALASKAAGVGAFVFASSCSVYGAGGSQAKTETDPTDPLTDYAASKLDAEAALKSLADDDFVVTCLRFATACGPSPRLRLDLVLNDFVASAKTTGRIKILSDGTPLRPLIDVRDMGRAIEWAQKRDAARGGAFLTVNAGCDDWNFSVRELAERVAEVFGDVAVDINANAEPDNRSYKVDFSLFRELAGPYYPARPIHDTINEIGASLTRCASPLEDFRDGNLMRLNLLRCMVGEGLLDRDIHWTER